MREQNKTKVQGIIIYIDHKLQVFVFVVVVFKSDNYEKLNVALDKLPMAM